MHLIIDGFGGDKAKLGDIDQVHDLLYHLPIEIGMKKLSPPAVEPYHPLEKTYDWGVSGFVLIAESHISVHTFPARGILWADVFSCRDFNDQAIVLRFKETFSLTRVQSQVLARGLESEVST